MTDWSQSEIDDVRNGARKTAAELEKLNRKADQALENDKLLIEAFNRMAKAVESLASEVRGLRSDLSPKIEKKRYRGLTDQTG